jgi:hypothetical protein
MHLYLIIFEGLIFKYVLSRLQKQCDIWSLNYFS